MHSSVRIGPTKSILRTTYQATGDAPHAPRLAGTINFPEILNYIFRVRLLDNFTAEKLSLNFSLYRQTPCVTIYLSFELHRPVAFTINTYVRRRTYQYLILQYHLVTRTYLPTKKKHDK